MAQDPKNPRNPIPPSEPEQRGQVPRKKLQ